MMDAIAQHERDKYTRMWAVQDYRRKSPGEEVAEQALRLMGARAGESIMDYGSGTCRAAAIFRDWGLEVRCIDIASNAKDECQDFKVIIATLWDLPPWVGATDYAFCADVLEHLPEDKIDAALEQMAQRTRIRGFLQPALFEDGFGKRIGEPLHLTVKPKEWWLDTVSRHWCLEAISTLNGKHLQLLARRRAS